MRTAHTCCSKGVHGSPLGPNSLTFLREKVELPDLLFPFDLFENCSCKVVKAPSESLPEPSLLSLDLGWHTPVISAVDNSRDFRVNILFSPRSFLLKASWFFFRAASSPGVRIFFCGTGFSGEADSNRHWSAWFVFTLRDGPAIAEGEATVAFVLDFFLGEGCSSESSSVKSIGESVRLRGFEVVFLGDGICKKKEDITGCWEDPSWVEDLTIR